MIFPIDIDNSEHVEAFRVLFTQQARHHNECGRGLYETPWSDSDIAKAERNLRESVADGSRQVMFYSAGEEEAISGMCAYRTFSEWIDGVKVAFVDELVVSEGRRGQGIGHRFLAELEGALRAEGYDGFQLSCYIANKSAIAFYESAGFTPVGMEYEKKFC